MRKPTRPTPLRPASQHAGQYEADDPVLAAICAQAPAQLHGPLYVLHRTSRLLAECGNAEAAIQATAAGLSAGGHREPEGGEP